MELQRAISGRIASATTSPKTIDLADRSLAGSSCAESSLPSPSPSDTVSASDVTECSEKDHFLSDLDHFIPVGVLKYYDGGSAGHGNVGDGFVTPYPQSEVKNLESHGWIRTSFCKNRAYPGWSVVQVYVLPDDTGHKVVPRSSPSLRRTLKLVMSKLDTSAEAWEGQFDPASMPAQGSKDEQESLFYIFNTLDPPEPDPDVLSDSWASQAMDHLLWSENDFSSESDGQMRSVGLKTHLYSYQRRSAAFMIQKESEPGQSLDPRLQCFEGPTGQPYYYDKAEGSIVREKRLYSNACGGK